MGVLWLMQVGGELLGEVSWKLSPVFFVGVEGVASVAVMGFCGVSTSIVSAYWGRVRHTQHLSSFMGT